MAGIYLWFCYLVWSSFFFFHLSPSLSAILQYYLSPLSPNLLALFLLLTFYFIFIFGFLYFFFLCPFLGSSLLARFLFLLTAANLRLVAFPPWLSVSLVAEGVPVSPSTSTFGPSHSYASRLHLRVAIGQKT